MHAANCGVGCPLRLRCGRCQSVVFCGRACQRSYWPFHRHECKRNEIAEAVEAAEPKFADFLRKHGRQAVLRDDEVERLERASRAACASAGRAEVMESMYGRLDPKPLPPSYTAEELSAVRSRQLRESQAARFESTQDCAWRSIDVPCGLGTEAGRYKWRQSQSHVEAFWRVPEGVAARRVKVTLSATRLAVCLGGDSGAWDLRGTLLQEVVPGSSTWFIADGVLHVSLLKRYRKGCYRAGGTNADTWWRSLLQTAGDTERIALPQPPTDYYLTVPYEEDDLPAAVALRALTG